MTTRQLLEFCNPIKLEGPKPDALGVLCQDSRAVRDHDIFIAIRGTTTDGHNYIQQAVQNGASVVICEDIPEANNGALFVQVENTRRLIGPLAQFLQDNPAEELTVIGITGTNGKTTVATLVWQILQKLSVNASLLGTVEKRINNKKAESRLTTSDPVEIASDMREMVDAGSTHLVMEVSSHALHQQRVNGIKFDAAAFTNLSLDHLDYHAEMKNYAAAKQLLFNSLGSETCAIINADDSYGEYMASSTGAEILFFSFKNRAGISCNLIQMNQEGLSIEVDGTKLVSPLIGMFNAYNLAEAFLLCRCTGFRSDEIASVVRSCSGAPGRLERVERIDESENKSDPLILVDYAHTPDALENVASTVRDTKNDGQNLILIFGCGGDRDKSKRPVMAEISGKYADRVIVTTDNPRSENPESIIEDILSGFSAGFRPEVIVSRRDAILQTIRGASANDIILIAGKGHETYQEVNGERHHFDDREVARTALQQRNGKPETTEVA